MKTTLSLSMDSTDNLTGTNSIQAYELYLQGMQNWHLRELSTLRKAEELFLRAIAINPSFATAYQWYGTVDEVAGNPEEGLREFQRAFELDPRQPRDPR